MILHAQISRHIKFWTFEQNFETQTSGKFALIKKIKWNRIKIKLFQNRN